MTTATTSDPGATTDAPRPVSRISGLDGLRGITIVLVVVGHFSAFLWPEDGIRSIPYLRGLVGGGAVTVFFVVSGYLVTRGLLRDEQRGELDPLRFLARRLVRVGAQVGPLCAAIVVVATTDALDPFTSDTTMRTVTNTLTYTNNWLYALNPLGARDDMGHLWFLSIQQQWYLVLPLVVILLARRRRLFLLLVLATAAASAAYRVTTVSDETWFALSVNTFARADALLLGVAVGVAAPWMRPLARHASLVGWVGLLALLGLVLVNREISPLAFLEWWSVVFAVVAMLVVACLVVLDPESSLARVLGTRWLAWLGRASLVVYVWHYPIIFWIGRHTETWTWPAQTIVAMTMLVAVTWASYRWVEQPARRWLATNLRPPQVTPGSSEPLTSPSVDDTSSRGATR